ncbi:MAG: PA2779 family protein [Deltaproteobacteria bacterium]|nr:PA2779 family protein [Deltaproteobacteria bacterium]
MSNILYTRTGRRVLQLMLALSFALALCPANGAWAGFAPTAGVRSGADADLEKIRSFLEIKKVTNTLEAMGYDRAEVESRLAGLSADEISDLAGRLDGAMVPAGDSGVGIAIGVVVVVLVVLGILSLMGKRVVVAE